MEEYGQYESRCVLDSCHVTLSQSLRKLMKDFTLTPPAWRSFYVYSIFSDVFLLQPDSEKKRQKEGEKRAIKLMRDRN